MPDLLPFPALRYDPAAVPDVGALLCPPYDVVSADQRERLAAQPHNAIHLELPVAPAGGDRYAHAAQLLAEWQSAHVLRLDERPMTYLYEQEYRLPGAAPEQTRRARGLFCRLRLEEPGRGVLRHERTMSAPKLDRYRLLEAVRANLSPVLMLYRSSRAGAASRELIDRLVEGKPVVDARTEDARHRLWALGPEQSTDAAALLELAAAGPLAIADGHHRYETALRYRDEVGGAGAEYVLVLLYDAESGGLGVLPTHRLLAGVPDVDALSGAMAELFETEPVPDAIQLERRVAAAGVGRLGMWTRHGGLLLRPRALASEALLPAGSPALRDLDVTILAAALERALGLSTGRLGDEGRLSYSKDAGEAVALVDEGAADACFLLNATPVPAMLEVAAAGELMPPKSTYFVPKAATGLVFNVLAA